MSDGKTFFYRAFGCLIWLIVGIIVAILLVVGISILIDFIYLVL